jgi:hypothetical protein
MTNVNSLKRNGGGDRTRTCMPFRAAVFKTAALPLCDPSAPWLSETISQAVCGLNPGRMEVAYRTQDSGRYWFGLDLT